MILDKRINSSLYVIILLFVSLNYSNSPLNAHNEIYGTTFLGSDLPSKKLFFHLVQTNITKTSNIEDDSYRKHCADQIEVSESSLLYKKEDVDCVENLIKSCQESEAYLLYATGSLQLKIRGLLNGICRINILYEIERDSANYICAIPFLKLKAWEDWKNGDGLDTLGNMTIFCSQNNKDY